MSFASDISVRFIITMSKVTAILLLIASIWIDIQQKTGGENIRFNTPWIAGMIGLKQWVEYAKIKASNGK